MKTREKFFSFVVKTDFTGSHHRFDQCGIVMYLDSENWLNLFELCRVAREEERSSILLAHEGVY